MASSSPDSESPYRHDNWWFADDDGGDAGEADDTSADDGAGTASAPDAPDPGHMTAVSAATIMHQELSFVVDPVCARSLAEEGIEVGLTEPTAFLPQRRTDESGRDVEYGQDQRPRRVNPETGYIAGGETTATGLPEVDKDTYMQAVTNVLSRFGVSHTNVEAWRDHAERLFHDPQFNSKKALTVFIRHKRAYDRGERSQVP